MRASLEYWGCTCAAGSGGGSGVVLLSGRERYGYA